MPLLLLAWIIAAFKGKRNDILSSSLLLFNDENIAFGKEMLILRQAVTVKSYLLNFYDFENM